MTKASFYHTLPSHAETFNTYIWEEKNFSNFNELIIGWNAYRPDTGFYQISVSLKLQEWSPWFPYAIWGVNYQRSFKHEWGPIKIFQDTIHISSGYAFGLRIKVEAIDAHLKDFHALYISTPPLLKEDQKRFSFVSLDVPKISQIKIKDPRNMRICSPTSTTAAIRYLKKNHPLAPLEFAEKVYDSQFDIYGHWVFAAAQAYAELGKEWETQVMFLRDFEDLWQFLLSGYPVVVSVKGPLPGALHPYEQGHLLVVRGFDPDTRQVLCMDPGYPEDSQTYAAYGLDDFSLAWQRRKNIAYTFQRSSHRVNIPIG